LSERSAAAPPEALEEVFRRESGQILATLIRACGDFDLAEDALQDAVATAAERWPGEGVPPNPGGWLTSAARRHAIDRIRRDRRFATKLAALGALNGQQKHEPVEDTAAPEERHDGAVRDDRLRLIFTCCHPALSTEAQVALTLRTLGGSRRPRSRTPSSSPSQRWRSASCARSARFGTPASRIASRRHGSCRSASVPC
jgi:RNA polymerase sigma-70 factor (ECF subfamily)